VKDSDTYTDVFTPQVLAAVLPAGRSDRFFDALYGDPSEGAYDIVLDFRGADEDHLHFALELRQRPDKCLVCSLTHGLPEVLKRHPVIDLESVVRELCAHLENGIRCHEWTLGRTREVSPDLHEILLRIRIRSV
jgi:hypothetical protein